MSMTDLVSNFKNAFITLSSKQPVTEEVKSHLNKQFSNPEFDKVCRGSYPFYARVETPEVTIEGYKRGNITSTHRVTSREGTAVFVKHDDTVRIIDHDKMIYANSKDVESLRKITQYFRNLFKWDMLDDGFDIVSFGPIEYCRTKCSCNGLIGYGYSSRDLVRHVFKAGDVKYKYTIIRDNLISTNITAKYTEVPPSTFNKYIPIISGGSNNGKEE